MPTAKSTSRKKNTAKSSAAARNKRPAGKRAAALPRRAETAKRRIKDGAAKRTLRTKTARKQGSTWSSATKLCSFCQSQNPPKAKICLHCGAPFGKSGAPVSAMKAGGVAQSLQPVETGSPRRSQRLARLLEILPALVGIFGIGWIYAGNRSTGLLFLVGMLVWDAFSIAAAIFTGGLALYVTLPISALMIIIISVISLNSYLKRNPNVFSSY